MGRGPSATNEETAPFARHCYTAPALPEDRSTTPTPSDRGTEEQLLAWRREFPTLEQSTYLINNSLGAMPRAVKTSLAEFSRLWVELGVRAWEQSWWQMSGELGNLLGAIIGAADNSVSIHQNVTTAQAVICSSVPPSPRRNRVVYSELNFPSVRYLYQAQPELEVKVVPCPDRISVPVDALVDAIDEIAKLRAAAQCRDHNDVKVIRQAPFTHSIL